MYDGRAGKIMRKRLISICSVAILIFNIYGCAQTAEDTSAAETKTTADAIEQEEQTTDGSVLQEESEPGKEIDYDRLYIYIPILEEYERAWEDEDYTIEELQNVAGVFITLTDAKFRLGTKEKDYALYYSMSDLTGDGTEELIIGIRGEDEIASCFLYTGDGERIHMTDSRTWSDLVEKPTILYENGVVESTEYIKCGMCRYNFYQLSFVYTSPREVGRKELIDCYFYIEDSENGNRYYKGDIANPITEEEFWNGINDYESMPQIKLDWHELEGFWEPDEEVAGITVIGEERRQSEKEESEDEAADSKEEESEDEPESKKDEPITVVAKETSYNSDGNIWEKSEYEYDSAGNQVKQTVYYGDGSIAYWDEYEYDSARNQVKSISYLADGRVANWDESKYDSAGSRVMWIRYKADGSIDNWYGWEHDSTGNTVKDIWFRPNGRVDNWSEYEYDSAGNQVKYIWYDADGSVDRWSEYEYDSEGKLVKKTSYSGSTNFYLDEYEYDSAGNQTKDIVYKKSDGDILSGWNEMEYDSTGNQVKNIRYNADGSITYISEYEYDSAGNVTKRIGYYGDGSVEWWHEYEYEYDNTGNLTRKIVYEPDGRTEYEYITIIPQ